MSTDGGSRRRCTGVIRNDGEQKCARRRRVVAGLQNGTNGTDLAMTMRVGVERVRDGAALHRTQQQP